ncbi:MAG: hypothetical protein H8E47_00335 [Anaerolineales bacterium]|nr:hypothetical protein [Anaerolineales bacterium]
MDSCLYLALRIPLDYATLDQGLGMARPVAGRMATARGWDGAEIARQIAAYGHEVALTRSYRLA